MTGRERLLIAISNQKADRLPVQVHNFMRYYLQHYLNGMTDVQAYTYFGMDPVLYRDPIPVYSTDDLQKWEEEWIWDSEIKADNARDFIHKITTPEGVLTSTGTRNQYTTFLKKHLIENDRDFEIWNRYVPIPERFDWTPVLEAKSQVGEKGIVRGTFWGFGQGSPWQSLAGYLMDMQEAIYTAYDEPDKMHEMLKCLSEKKLIAIDRAGKFELDLVETGGGAGSSTVISPEMHKEFCLPYDIEQHAAIHEQGSKVVYHLCGGIMPLLEIVADNGADGLETMTPPSMGGDCDIAEAAKRIGDKMFFIGGFDQNAGFENGTIENVREQVFKLFEACKNGGYICSPSDHFFHGSPELIRAFVETTKECIY